MAQEIRRKFKRIFIVRAVLLAFLVVLSVVFSTLTLEQFLIKSALQSEAGYFWENYSQDSTTTAPNTWNLKGFFFDGQDLPDQQIDTLKNFLLLESSEIFNAGHGYESLRDTDSTFAAIQTGFTRLRYQPGYTLLHKTTQGDQSLILVFDGENVRSLAIFLGLIPLVLFLLVSYLLVWLFYTKAKEVLSPITWLAAKFGDFNPVSANMPTIDLNEMPSDADYEATVLAESLSKYVQRIEHFVSRERAFTRDVSHELRTPLTVINMATEVMEANQDLTDKDQKTLARIKGASKDMLELVEVFLILARESDSQLEETLVDINEVIEHELLQSKSLLQDKDVQIDINQKGELELKSSAKILEVLIGNLIRNAFKYTEAGSVTIEINTNSVAIIDTGIGMTESQVDQVFKPYFRAGARPEGGHGVGLAIVKRISDRFNWPVKIQSQPNKGTTVIVEFPAEIV